MSYSNAAVGRYATRVVVGEEVPPRDQAPQTGDIAVPGKSDNEPEIRFQLEPIRPAWNDYVNFHAARTAADAFMKEFKTLLRHQKRNANTLVLDGFRVATYKPVAKLHMKMLAAERPDIVAKYTRVVPKAEFDEQAFRAEMPDVWASYRSQALHLIDEPTPIIS